MSQRLITFLSLIVLLGCWSAADALEVCLYRGKGLRHSREPKKDRELKGGKGGGGGLFNGGYTAQRGGSGKGSGSGFTGNGVGGLMVIKNPSTPRYWWPTNTCDDNGKYWFQFDFENGERIAGQSSSMNYVANVRGVASPITLHVSCSDDFSNVVGDMMYGEKGGPVHSLGHPGLKDVKILKFSGCQVEKECCAGDECVETPPKIAIQVTRSLDSEENGDGDFWEAHEEDGAGAVSKEGRGFWERELGGSYSSSSKSSKSSKSKSGYSHSKSGYSHSKSGYRQHRKRISRGSMHSYKSRRHSRAARHSPS